MKVITKDDITGWTVIWTGHIKSRVRNMKNRSLQIKPRKNVEGTEMNCKEEKLKNLYNLCQYYWQNYRDRRLRL